MCLKYQNDCLPKENPKFHAKKNWFNEIFQIPIKNKYPFLGSVFLSNHRLKNVTNTCTRKDSVLMPENN